MTAPCSYPPAFITGEECAPSQEVKSPGAPRHLHWHRQSVYVQRGDGRVRGSSPYDVLNTRCQHHWRGRGRDVGKSGKESVS